LATSVAREGEEVPLTITQSRIGTLFESPAIPESQAVGAFQEAQADKPVTAATGTANRATNRLHWNITPPTSEADNERIKGFPGETGLPVLCVLKGCFGDLNGCLATSG